MDTLTFSASVTKGPGAKGPVRHGGLPLGGAFFLSLIPSYNSQSERKHSGVPLGHSGGTSVGVLCSGTLAGVLRWFGSCCFGEQGLGV